MKIHFCYNKNVAAHAACRHGKGRIKTQTKARQNEKEILQKAYITHGADGLLDREILELVLNYAAPDCRAKHEAQRILAHFGSLENIFSAGEKKFSQMTGMSEAAGVLFSLMHNCPRRAGASRNTGVTHIKNAADAKLYFNNILYEEPIEKVALMCLGSERQILSCRIVSDGTVNLSEVSMQKAMFSLSDVQARFAILAHNHPRGSAQPSAKDIKFTVKAREAFGKMGIKLIDHIIVGEDETVSLSTTERFKKYFNALPKNTGSG